ncbi:histidine phosphatase family protein [Corynebacterium sp. TAE3-ERU12]|uniref:histidine phosphatase family protein n=1 Tax=Corynebacterium sp. TAE3-ERU12 TaxID=2849491 RepID=UPI001C4737B5|nr:histidine phosphatase family protein [Corynebacterium sp. TAE3-ERU12]MBV7294989.1 histidine phosphatase family protein [Corynebacterium sp. TAE3-ERU12]
MADQWDREGNLTVVAPRRLLLLRHGQTSYNATRRMQGQLDTQLSDVGLRQADNVAAHFAARDFGISRIISSDLSRARMTAQAVGKQVGVDVTTDPRLRETRLGDWAGQTHHEIDADYPGQRAHWRHNPGWAPPGGETRFEVAQRMRVVVDELLANYAEWPGHTVLLVAHGGAIAALTASLTDLPKSHYMMFNGMRNTAWVELSAKLRPDGELAWYLDAFNCEATQPADEA